jgi:hypothetical protein
MKDGRDIGWKRRNRKEKERKMLFFWNYILLTTVSKNPKARRANKALGIWSI